MYTSPPSLKLLSVVRMDEREESDADEILFVVRVVGLHKIKVEQKKKQVYFHPNWSKLSQVLME